MVFRGWFRRAKLEVDTVLLVWTHRLHVIGGTPKSLTFEGQDK